MTTRDALRTLAHPGFVLALVVLVLNDHLLKQAWPGLVTGKLSDVAGLVVAPLLLAVPLALFRVPHAMPVAILATGVGFSVTKAFSTGAAVASGAWSLSGIPTQIRADVTDLVALPALYAAWLVHRRTVDAPRADLRSAVATATGVALLPVGVLATAATSQDCSGYLGLDKAVLVKGSFTGVPGIQHRVVVRGDFLGTVSVESSGRITHLPDADVERMPPAVFRGFGDQSACDSAGACWRVVGDGAARVEMSHDGGETWAADYAMSDREAKAAIADVELPCDNEPRAEAQALAVFDQSAAAHVVVATAHAGILLRSSAGEWRRVSVAALQGSPRVPEPAPSPIIRRLQPSLPPTELESTDPTAEPSS